MYQLQGIQMHMQTDMHRCYLVIHAVVFLFVTLPTVIMQLQQEVQQTMHQLQAIQMHMQTGMNPLASPYNPINALNPQSTASRREEQPSLTSSTHGASSAVASIPSTSHASSPASSHSRTPSYSSSSQEMDLKPPVSFPSQHHPSHVTNHSFHLPLGVTLSDLNSGHQSDMKQQAAGLSDHPTPQAHPAIARQPLGISELTSCRADGVSYDEASRGQSGGERLREDAAGMSYNTAWQPDSHSSAPGSFPVPNKPAVGITGNATASHSRHFPSTVSSTHDDVKTQGSMSSDNAAYAGSGNTTADLSHLSGHQAALGTFSGRRIAGSGEAPSEVRREGEAGFDWVLPLSASSVGLSAPAKSTGELCSASCDQVTQPLLCRSRCTIQWLLVVKTTCFVYVRL